ncbi:VOC family protein [Yoonia sp. SS1-5]|uniref:VOC family protein n=1 Tax=Yoonia rhodophyticola TaxID=3137370 RepID=A0AAN0NKZ7_9RHOB
MIKHIAHFAILIPDYDAALRFFTSIGFECLEDTQLEEGKRWVRVAPKGSQTEILLAKAATKNQLQTVGKQGGGRVWLFLETDDFEADYSLLKKAGVKFEEQPRTEAYGRVVVWNDPWGNRWDLIQRT